MGLNRTSKSCYESRYGGGWITAPMRLSEFMCGRIAGDETLGVKFWKNKPWDNIYRRELTLANRLLQKYSVEAINRALKSKEGRRVKSLTAPFFVPMLEIEQRKLDAETKQLELASKPEPVNTLQKPRPIKRHGKSIRERLADIDNAPPSQGGFGFNDSE